MMYNNIVESCFFYPRHVGVVTINQPLTAHYHSQVGGQKITLDLYLVCTKDKIISRACFKAVGGPYVIAALEWICREIEGKALSQLPSIDYSKLVEVLAIPQHLYPVAIQVNQAYQQVLHLMNGTFEELER